MSATIKLSCHERHLFWEVPVLFEDAHLLVLDKPAELLLAPAPEAPDEPSLLRLLHAGIAEKKPWSLEPGRAWLMNAHKLDRETSGVAVLAKSQAALGTVMDWFGAERPGRQFVALVRGAPGEDRFELTARLAPHPVKAGLMRVDHQRGKRSCTRCQVLERFAGWTLLQCEPLTDRLHQVRIHLRYAGLPVAGDRQYGGRPLLLSKLKRHYRLKPGHFEVPLFEEAAVHAAAVTLPHPVTGQPLALVSPLPRTFAVALKFLRRYAATTATLAATSPEAGTEAAP